VKKYHKTEKYDKDWINKNKMGPNPIMLMEELCEHLDLKSGMKVLDMGCGKGLTSIFLAKEYGVTVFANDLWISATDNLHRFEEAGVADRVFPIHAEAHSLPYANEFFDVAVSIDSYHYYGACEYYFPEIYSNLVKPGGQFGIVVPGYTREFEDGHPEWKKKFLDKKRNESGSKTWGNDMFTFHSNKWWRKFWEKTGLVEITACYDIEDAHEIWREEWMEYIETDTEKDATLIVMTAVKK
jgi:SAM-dependent methyltransferase